MKPKELVKALEKNGWYIKRIHGSHYILENTTTKITEVIPMHNKDLKPGLLNAILKRANLKR